LRLTSFLAFSFFDFFLEAAIWAGVAEGDELSFAWILSMVVGGGARRNRLMKGALPEEEEEEDFFDEEDENLRGLDEDEVAGDLEKRRLIKLRLGAGL